jgi:hypothetical protein
MLLANSFLTNALSDRLTSSSLDGKNVLDNNRTLLRPPKPAAKPKSKAKGAKL